MGLGTMPGGKKGSERVNMTGPSLRRQASNILSSPTSPKGRSAAPEIDEPVHADSFPPNSAGYEAARDFMRNSTELGLTLPSIDKIVHKLVTIGDCHVGLPRANFPKRRKGSVERALIDTMNANRMPANRLVYSTCKGRPMRRSMSTPLVAAARPVATNLPKRVRPSLYETMVLDVGALGLGLLSDGEAYKRLVQQTLAAEVVAQSKQTWNGAGATRAAKRGVINPHVDPALPPQPHTQVSVDSMGRFVTDGDPQGFTEVSAGVLSPLASLSRKNSVIKNAEGPFKTAQELRNKNEMLAQAAATAASSAASALVRPSTRALLEIETESDEDSDELPLSCDVEDAEKMKFSRDAVPDTTQVLAQYFQDVCSATVNKRTNKRGVINPHAVVPEIAVIPKSPNRRRGEEGIEFANLKPPDHATFDLDQVHQASGLLQAIARQWHENPNLLLQVVTIRSKGITGDAAAVLFESVAKGLPCLRELDLSGNDLNYCDQLPKALCGMCERSRTLELLDLSNCHLKEEVLSTMFGAIEIAPRLQTLRLSRNKMGPASVKCLGKMLATQRGMKDLVLSDNNIGSSFGLLAIGVEENATLENLDVSWNGIDDIGLVGFVSGLRVNTSILKLDLSHNRIKETSALVLMDALKKDNTTLKHCHLDFNQLGSTGGRAVAAIKDDKENGCNITMANCSFQDVGGKGGDFNPEDPNGYYELDLSKPYNCTVAKMLVEMAYDSSIDNMWNIKLDNVPLKLPRESRWEVPSEGYLRFTYVHTFRRPTPEDAISMDMLRLLCLTLENCLESEKREQLSLRAAEYWFMAAQVIVLLDYFPFSLDKVEVTASLWAKVVDPDELKKLLSGVMEPKECESLKRTLGTLYYFNRDNCTGYYNLDFEDNYDRVVMRFLLAVSADEGRKRRAEDLPDISQTGNFEGFRNEKFKGEPIVCESTTWATKTIGRFKCDFVSYERPPGCADWMPDDLFDEWLAQIKPRALEFSLPEDGDWQNAVDVEIDLAAVLMDGVEEVSCYKKPEKKEIVEDDGDPVDKITSLEWGFLNWLREESTKDCPASDDTFVRYVSAEQLGKILKVIPPHLRTEAMVIMWGRLVDEEESKEAFSKLKPDQYLDCFKRVGSLQLFNPLAPEGPYRLDLAMHEHYILGKLLLRLAMHEPGDNLVGEMYKGMGFETPATWLTDFPHKGVWEFSYATVDMEGDPEQATWKYETSADPEFRKTMAIDDLGWEFDESDDDD